MNRVMIVGQPGAGKSWLAKQIGARTGLPVMHMDTIFFKEGWTLRERSERIEMARQVEAGDAWIFEGGMPATYDNRLDRADTLIVLEFPLLLRMWRVFWRTVKYYGRTRPDVPEGCPERFNYGFWKWIWDTRKSARIRNRQLIETAGPEKHVFVLRNRREMARFLQGLDSAGKKRHDGSYGNTAY